MDSKDKRSSLQARPPESSKAPEFKSDERPELGERLFYKTSSGNAFLNDLKVLISETLQQTRQEAEEDRELARREVEKARKADAEKHNQHIADFEQQMRDLNASIILLTETIKQTLPSRSSPTRSLPTQSPPTLSPPTRPQDDPPPGRRNGNLGGESNP